MVLVLFEIRANQKGLLMAPKMTEEGAVATLLLAQESVGQRVGMKSLGMTL
jgi:hypothetical protein